MNAYVHFLLIYAIICPNCRLQKMMPKHVIYAMIECPNNTNKLSMNTEYGLVI